MNEVIKILMERDGESYEDAKAIFMDTKEEIQELLADGGSYDDVEDILAANLGLEMDYIFNFI